MKICIFIYKVFYNKSVEIYLWDGIALIRRGSDIYVNEPHISGGVPILSKTDEGVRYHEHDFLGTTLWSSDRKGGSAASIEGATPLNTPFILKGFRAIYHFGAYFVRPFLSKKIFLRTNILIMGERAILRRPPPPLSRAGAREVNSNHLIYAVSY